MHTQCRYIPRDAPTTPNPNHLRLRHGTPRAVVEPTPSYLCAQTPVSVAMTETSNHEDRAVQPAPLYDDIVKLFTIAMVT